MTSRKTRPGELTAAPDPQQLSLSLRAQLKAYSQFASSINSTLKDVNQIHTELDVESKPINLVKGRLDRSYDLVGEQTAEELKRIDAAIETLDQLIKIPTATSAPSPAPQPPPVAAAPTPPTGNKRGPYKKRIKTDGSTSSAPSPSNSAAPSPAPYHINSPSSSSNNLPSLARSSSTTGTKPIAPAPSSHTASPAVSASGSSKKQGGGSKASSRKDQLAAQLPLTPGRQVAFRQPVKGPGGQEFKGKEEWILANILSATDKNRYIVEDVDYDPNNPTPDEGKYATTLRNIVPLPDRRNPSLTYPDSDYTPGTQVMALYPDTTSFYRAVIVGGPVVIGGGKQTKKDKDKPAAYRLKFEDDDDTVREVAIELVVELP